MWWNSASALILMLAATGSCLTGIIMAICSQQRQSRCSKISCCCGLFSCERDVMSDDLAKAQMEMDDHNQTNPPSQPPPTSSKYDDV